MVTFCHAVLHQSVILPILCIYLCNIVTFYLKSYATDAQTAVCVYYILSQTQAIHPQIDRH